MKESVWYRIDVCSECENRLTGNEISYSGGVCPKCGYDSNSTVCNTERVILKEFAHNPWWKFWDRKYTYKGRNEFSKNWCKTH